MSMARVTAVVLNWCNEHDTKACVDSLERQDYRAFKILLVDNGSPDGSGARLHARYPAVSYLQTDKNLGYAGGNNRGMKWALEDGADFVLVVNNDTVLDPRCVRELVATAEAHGDAGAVGAKILRYDQPDRIWFGGGRFDRLRAIGVHEREKFVDLDPRERDVLEATFLTGCCLLIPANTIKAVGYFRDDFFCYLEDAEYGLRVMKSGVRLLYAPAARLRHRVPPMGTQPSPAQIQLRDRNRRRIVRLHYAQRGVHSFRDLVFPKSNRVDAQVCVAGRTRESTCCMEGNDRGMTRAVSAIVLAIGMSAISACDPCAGIASCRVVPTVSATGQVIDYASGNPISGATVSFAPVGSTTLSGTISGATDSHGQFQLNGVASGDGTVTGDITVHASTFPGGYTVHGFQLTTSRVRGEGLDLGRVLAQPYFAFLGQVQLRFVGTRVVSTVQIQRTGGASLTNNDITAQTDTNGLFYLEFAASSADPVIANVTITQPGSTAPVVFQATSLPVIWRDQVPAVDRVFSLGGSLGYVVQAIHRGLDRGVPGVAFSWNRVSGISTTPTSLSGISNEIGLFSLQTEPSGEGTVTGNIVMTPPAPYAPQHLQQRAAADIRQRHAASARDVQVWAGSSLRRAAVQSGDWSAGSRRASGFHPHRRRRRTTAHRYEQLGWSFSHCSVHGPDRRDRRQSCFPLPAASCT